MTDTSDLPPAEGVEVAFAGRSNAGKSSAINAIAQRKRIAYVSKTPGRTQQINFFSLGNERYLVDLPGYGYAAVPAAARAHWNELVGGYVQTRTTLGGVVLIMDVRHPLTELDRQLIEWLAPTGVRVHILLSKADKLSRQRAAASLHSVEHIVRMDYANCTAQLFSSTHKIGIAQAAQVIAGWLDEDRVRKKPPVKGE